MASGPRACSARLYAGVWGLWLSSAVVLWADVQLRSVMPRGLQSGGTTTVTLEGVNLGADTRLVLAVPIKSQRVLPGATANRAQLEVALDPGIAPGVYNLRAANAKGISNAVLISIDALPQRTVAPVLEGLPAAVSGPLAGGTTVRFAFDGKQTQRVSIDVEARRLGANLDPVIVFRDNNRRQVGFAQSKTPLGGDTRLEIRLPHDGRYHVELHDLRYQAGGDGFFRLKIGDLHQVELVEPLGARRGGIVPLQLHTNAGKKVAARLDLTQILGDTPVPIPIVEGLVGPAPRLRVGDDPEVDESAPMTKQPLAVPVVINGAVRQPKEEDRYVIEVEPGQKLRLDVLAHRAGSILDGVLQVRDEKGSVLATSDDRPGTTDPGMEIAVPTGVPRLVVAVTDLHASGSDRHVYRLSIAPANRPDFGLTALADRLEVPRGGTSLFRVRAARTSYSGPIRLTFVGLPFGVGVAGDEIPSNATDALVTLVAPSSQPTLQGLFAIHGASVDQVPNVRRLARATNRPGVPLHPWLGGELGFAVVDPGPLRVDWLAADDRLPLGYHQEATVRVTRSAGVKGAVRLSAVTSQIVPRTRDNQREDVNRALRLEGTPTLPDGQDQTTVRLVVPADLPRIAYDIAIQGELLGADNKTVVAAAVAPARRFLPEDALRLHLASSSVEARAGDGETGQLRGKVVRLAGVNVPVVLTLAGLPPDIPSPAVELPPTTTEFAFPVRFPFGTKTGPLANVTLLAQAETAPGRVLTAPAVPVSLTVAAGSAPPPPKGSLVKLFDDELDFVHYLYEGDGKASIERGDRYSGPYALRVTAAQRFRAAMPHWGYRIVEKPSAPGEFRYLRFAWKKKGGDNILLQLNVNGAWGATRGAGKPGYRYEAGSANNPYNVEAKQIDKKLPTEWTVVTRDLYADFGAFTLTGIAFTPGPGEFGLFDHLYLGRSLDDLKGCPAPKASQKPLAQQR